MSIIQGNTKVSAGVYPIDQSIRFNDNDSAYLTRTPASAGDKRTWTFSVWTKRGNLGADRRIFTAANNGTEFFFDANDKLNFYHYSGGYVWQYISTAVFRDCASWYHFLLRVDTTDATAGNRIRVYANGQQINDWDTSTAPSQNAEGFVNGTSAHYIGRYSGSNSSHWDGYLAEINHVDGSSLAPTEFGKTNSSTGQWVPKKYAGSYGTNGFYITGADSADLGADDSGNGNNFTSSGLTSADQFGDTPTNNYCTLDPNNTPKETPTLSDGNLNYAYGAAQSAEAGATITVPATGKWVWEVQAAAGTTVGMVLAPSTWQASTAISAVTDGVVIANSGTVEIDNVAQTSSDWNGTQVLRVEWDRDTDTIELFIDGTTSSGGTYTWDGNGEEQMIWIGRWSGSPNVDMNFGAAGFAGTPTSGFQTLCTANLADATIADPSAHFQTTLYTGNGTAIGSGGNEVNQSGNSTFQPDFVWIKNRDAIDNHMLYDAVRGATIDLHSNTTDAEATDTEGLSTFDADGFTVGSNVEVNTNTENYVAWQWKANGSGSSNTDGSITSTVSANTASGFSIVQYTGNATATQTVGHGLGVTPGMVIIKKTSASGNNWQVWHQNLSATSGKLIELNTTTAEQSSTTIFETAPTSSVFGIGNASAVNASGATFIAYCFSEVEGFSKLGTFSGNGSTTDGPFIYTGFTPEFFMWKRTDSATNGDWTMMDTKRDPFNMAERNMRANSTIADDTGEADLDFVSNGIKHRGGTFARFNANGATYVYMAFASSPFKTANAR